MIFIFFLNLMDLLHWVDSVVVHKNSDTFLCTIMYSVRHDFCITNFKMDNGMVGKGVEFISKYQITK